MYGVVTAGYQARHRGGVSGRAQRRGHRGGVTGGDVRSGKGIAAPCSIKGRSFKPYARRAAVVTRRSFRGDRVCMSGGGRPYPKVLS